MRIIALASFFVLLSPGCTVLPDGVEGYEERCIKLNAEPIPPTTDDPHLGNKNVYACDVELEKLVDGSAIPYADGTMIVKESFREGEDFPWLLATAEKKSGSWEWKEYKRNFENEDFVQILAGEQVCRNCHEAVKESGDWIFTFYE
jgi:hypothetical protein